MPTDSESNESPARLFGFFQDLRLAWKLLRDGRVPLWAKAIPALSIAYLILPIDLLADPALGLGQMDDLAVIWLGLKLFLMACAKYMAGEPRYRATGEAPDVIETTYEVLD